MVRPSPTVDKSGSKRKSNNEKEGGSKKRASCRIKTKCSEKFEEESPEEEEWEEWEELNDEESEEEEESAEEEEESNEVSDKAQNNRDSRRVNKDGEFNFRIDPDILDCSICYEPLRPPIFQCRNGHIACSYCCPKIRNKCHFCSQPIGRMRCIALEKIVESIKSPCQYANFGCKLVFMIGLGKQQPCMVLLGEDGYFFLLLNKNHETFAGNVVSVICIAPKSSESEFSFEIRAESSESSLRLKTSAEKVRIWNGVHLGRTFLVVPDCFYANSNAQLSIVVCIRKA